MRGRGLIIALALVALALAPSAKSTRAAAQQCATALSGEADFVTFGSQTIDGKPVEVRALLMRPDAARPAPVVVMLHTARGMEAPGCYAEIQRMFRDWGYASLLIDHASGGHGGRSFESSVFDRINDLKGAAAALAAMPFIDAKNMFAVGWSRGALTLLLSLSTARGFGPEEPFPFRSAVAFYPTCPRRVADVPAPVLLLHGDQDRDAPIESCRQMSSALPDTAPFELVEYPGREHLFDLPWSTAFDPAAANDAWRRIRTHLLVDQGGKE